MTKIGRLQGRLRSFTCRCRQKCVGGMFGTCAHLCNGVSA